MRLTRREFATLTGAALLAPALPLRAESANIFVPGYNMPANVDPHQVMDVRGAELPQRLRQPLSL